MTLQTGPRRTKVAALKGSDKKAAFTLIELLIVSVIILALLSFSTPLLRKSFTDLELKETVSNISKFIALAQQKAIIERCSYAISFDFEAGTYRLSGVEGEGEDKKYKDLADRFGRLFEVPKSIKIEGNAKEIVFSPNGECSVVELELTNRNEKVMLINTTGTMGNVVVTEKK